MSKGFIYIMTNPAFSDMVKIGYAADVESRRRQLSTTALPFEYEVYATYETSGNLEDRKLHRIIDSLNPALRINSNREFFEMTPQKAYELLDAIATISGTKEKLKKVHPDETVRQMTRRPPVNFTECGIPVGAELVCTDDPSLVVRVTDDRHVEYNGERTSLSAISRRIRGRSTQGPAFFTYNGKKISEIAEETQWKNREQENHTQDNADKESREKDGPENVHENISVDAAVNHISRRPPVNFTECGIPVGAELVCTDDPSVVVRVVDDRHVEYNGEITSLSAISRRIRGYSTAGPHFFTYNGKKICDIAEESQWKEETGENDDDSAE